MTILTKFLSRVKISGKRQIFTVDRSSWVQNGTFAKNLEPGQNFWKISDSCFKMTVLTKFLNRVKISGKNLIFSVERSSNVKMTLFDQNLEMGQNFWKKSDFLSQNDHFDQILESGQNFWKKTDFHSGQVVRGQIWNFLPKILNQVKHFDQILESDQNFRKKYDFFGGQVPWGQKWNFFHKS